MTAEPSSIVVTLVCPDRPGIVAAVSEFFYAKGCDIAQSHQFGDERSAQFFMRLHLTTGPNSPSIDQLRADFSQVVDEFSMQATIHDLADRPRILIMVSKFDHCLYDLLYRSKSGHLNADIVAIVSNHRDLEPIALWHGVDFHHIAVSPDNKAEAEGELLELIKKLDVDLVVLARYMQILSENLCRELSGRAINIHHSFLPSFKGANPYRQAHDRGVKLIGATAHYVTSDLDEGPIIEQGVARVDHQASVKDLVELGKDVESQTLGRAVRWHTEHRIILNGARTVVFK